ncbi:hypothetical protein N7931_17975 [Catenovulum sp. 2E275]|uniref:hypothetical protein n=1 Tax=Catenovulum sp. 2E275 TaxID=2980497 RepID=UPI0021D2F912|nr:hypothetical protein [Catenovulum sp. 2E275]MCU4677515.1 hypothetical protein [Catenovulum sp. 2E275]
MNEFSLVNQIEQIETLLSALKQQTGQQSAHSRNQSYIQIHQLKTMVSQYCKDNQINLNDFALLANIGRATLTRTMQDPGNSNIKSIEAILNVMGKQLYIGNINNES